MKISLNWLSDFIDISPLKQDLKGVLSKLTLRGLEVEAIEDLSKGFDKVIVAQIEVRDRHPNADRLSVCRVNTGTEVLQIVCGAQNMKAGDKVALSQVGAHLPNGLKIEKGKIRDVESFGMLCSETELGIADTSEGILILPKDAPVGKPVASVLGREDVIFTLNVTPNRGDALSHRGVARELAAILGQKLKQPELKWPASANASQGTDSKFKVTIEAKEQCCQYFGRLIEGVKIQPSPDWLQKRLLAIGLRPINNVVDVTNYVLFEMGQPLHAFDAKKLAGGKIIVRRARPGEKMPLLDETEVALVDSDLVIADSEKAVALAGVMGGGNSEVTDSTSAILLEAAQFASTSVRKTARRLQKHSDSSHRFEREIDARSVQIALDRATKLIVDTAGGAAQIKVFDRPAVDRVTTANRFLAEKLPQVEVSISRLNAFLGTKLVAKEVAEVLTGIGFENRAGSSADALLVSIPSYRNDVERFEDICEEVLRVVGYDSVTPQVPRLEYMPDAYTAVDLRQRWMERLKAAFVSNGFSEAVNFGFTSRVLTERWGGPEFAKAVTLANPINEELTTMKTSLLGALFENAVAAFNHQQSNLRLFEVRPVFFRDEKSETGVREEWMMAGVLTGRAAVEALNARDRELDFFDLKGILESVLEQVGVRGVRFSAPKENERDGRFHPAQSALVAIGRGPCGVFGRLHPVVEAEFKIREPMFLFEVSIDRAIEVAKLDRKYQPIAKFPKVHRDLSLLVPVGTSADKILQTVLKHGKPLVESVGVVDLYSGDKIPAGTISLSISMVMGDASKTLEDAVVDQTSQKILAGLTKDLGVQLRLQ